MQVIHDNTHIELIGQLSHSPHSVMCHELTSKVM